MKKEQEKQGRESLLVRNGSEGGREVGQEGGEGAGWTRPHRWMRIQVFSCPEPGCRITAWDGKTLRVTQVISHMAQVLGLFPAPGSHVYTCPKSGLARAVAA